MERRNSENGLWRLMRLWPLVVIIVSVTGILYVMVDDLKDVQASTGKLWQKYSSNRDSIVELEKQTGIIEYRLQRVDDTLKIQGADIKAILTEVRK